MRKRDAISGIGGIGRFARLQLFQEFFGIIDLTGADEQADDLADRFFLGLRAQIERNLLWIDQISQRDRHEELLDSAPVIQLIDQPWQLKTAYPSRTRRRLSRFNGAFTILATSTPCRIFIAARWGGSWFGGNGSTLQRTGPSPAAPPSSPSRLPTLACRTLFSFSTSPSFG